MCQRGIPRRRCWTAQLYAQASLNPSLHRFSAAQLHRPFTPCAGAPMCCTAICPCGPGFAPSNGASLNRARGTSAASPRMIGRHDYHQLFLPPGARNIAGAIIHHSMMAEINFVAFQFVGNGRILMDNDFNRYCPPVFAINDLT